MEDSVERRNVGGWVGEHKCLKSKELKMSKNKVNERSQLQIHLPSRTQQWSLHRGVSSSSFLRNFFSSTAVEGANSNTLDEESQLLNTQHIYTHTQTTHTHTHCPIHCIHTTQACILCIHTYSTYYTDTHTTHTMHTYSQTRTTHTYILYTHRHTLYTNTHYRHNTTHYTHTDTNYTHTAHATHTDTHTIHTKQTYYTDTDNTTQHTVHTHTLHTVHITHIDTHYTHRHTIYTQTHTTHTDTTLTYALTHTCCFPSCICIHLHLCNCPPELEAVWTDWEGRKPLISLPESVDRRKVRRAKKESMESYKILGKITSGCGWQGPHG